jgi:two-component system phosphate regulon sensor histidine kinase PhoR
VKRLVKLSEITLVFTEIKANNYKISLMPVSLAKTVELAANLFPKDRKKISIEVNDSEERLTVQTDEKLILIVLEQVLDNAVKYTSDKGRVQVRLLREEQDVLIEVTDDGPGFSSKALEHMYELFSADNLKYRSHGFGIGLATVKTILDTMKAGLEISNLPHQGALVKITFTT